MGKIIFGIQTQLSQRMFSYLTPSCTKMKNMGEVQVGNGVKFDLKGKKMYLNENACASGAAKYELLSIFAQ